MKNKKNMLKFSILVVLLLGIIIAIKYYNLESYLDRSMLQSHLDALGMFAPLAYIILYTIATIIFLPGAPLTILGGLLFGTFYGTIYTVIGATIGATIAYLIAKYLARPFVEDIAKKKFTKLIEYDDKLKENGLATVLFLRFIPIFPFNGLNFALGITRVKTVDYILGTFIGIIPGTFVYTYFGNSLGMLDPIQIVTSVVLIILLSITYPLYKKYKKGKRSNKK